MDRRQFVAAGLAASALGALGASPAATGSHYYELRYYQLRNDLEPRRAHTFIGDVLVPALKKAGTGPIGAFSAVSGLRSPSVLLLIDYPSAETVNTVRDNLASNVAFVKARNEWEGGKVLPYERAEASLYRAFDGHPRMEEPAWAEGRRARLYEMRTYESKDAFAGSNKIAMFNQGEIDVFKQAGMETVFFGEAVFGQNLPHLTYMIGFDDMPHHDEAWGKFGNSEGWKAIRDKPGWSDAEAVSNITSVFLRPTGYSDIK